MLAKTVGPYHTAEGGQFWWRNNGVSYNPGANDGIELYSIIIKILFWSLAC